MLFMYNIYYLICAKIQYIEQYFSTKKLRNLHFLHRNADKMCDLERLFSDLLCNTRLYSFCILNRTIELLVLGSASRGSTKYSRKAEIAPVSHAKYEPTRLVFYQLTILVNSYRQIIYGP